jgi:hypothetical protein
MALNEAACICNHTVHMCLKYIRWISYKEKPVNVSRAFLNLGRYSPRRRPAAAASPPPSSS